MIVIAEAIVTATYITSAMTVINTFAILWLTRAFQKRDNADATSANTIAKLKTDLHDTTVKLIDERFRAITHEVNNHAQSVVVAIDEIKERLATGEDNFDGLGQADHRLALKLEKQTGELTTFIAQTCATKQDLKDHDREDIKRFDKIMEGQHAVATEVAQLVGAGGVAGRRKHD